VCACVCVRTLNNKIIIIIIIIGLLIFMQPEAENIHRNTDRETNYIYINI